MTYTVRPWLRALACAALLAAGPLAGAESGAESGAALAEGWGMGATERSARMDHVFTCTADARVVPEQREAICAGFLAVLAQSYPKVTFDRQAGGPGVELRILRASASGAALQLVWTDAAGRVREGREAGLSVMDRAMTAPMLDRLFRRVLAETPMP